MDFKAIFEQAPREVFASSFGCVKIETLNKSWHLVKQVDVKIVIETTFDNEKYGRYGYFVLASMGKLGDGTYAVNPDCRIDYSIDSKYIFIDGISYLTHGDHRGSSATQVAYTDRLFDDLLAMLQEHYPTHEISLEQFPYHFHRRGK